MRAILLVAVWAVLAGGPTRAAAPDELPPAAREVLKVFEQEAADIEKKCDAELKTVRDKTAVELKKVQDAFCKEAKLDEAVAVRDLIRHVQAGTTSAPVSTLPPAAQEIIKQHAETEAAVLKKFGAQVDERRRHACTELKKIQDLFCKEAKLDEAVAVRDLIRMVRDGVTQALPDPGYVNNPATDIGKVFLYAVTGVQAGQSIYGTDVYTTGSHLGMAAVHCGLVKPGQLGVVRVTILPGQARYEATMRHGVTSYGYGQWHVSFKVERAYGFVGKRLLPTAPTGSP